jgi:predicted N-acetyltransferase YhbS
VEIIPATLDEATDIATVHVRSWQGRGVGRGPMTAALSQLAAAGIRTAQVETVGGTSITEGRYRRPLP